MEECATAFRVAPLAWYNADMKRFVLTCAVLALAVSTGRATAEPITVTTTPVPLYAEAPARTDVGRLVYRGGLHLTSNDPRFGGFSALGVSSDGKRLVSISDHGARLSAHLSYDDKGNLAGLADTDLGALAGPDGASLIGKNWSDAESMSPGVEGEIIVAFEHHHRFWRYDPGDIRPRALKPPAELAGLPANNGVEALTLLDDGRLLALSEGAQTEAARVGWVSRRNGWDVLTYTTPDGFRPTGAATLPDGDVIVVERYFTVREGVRDRVRRIAAKDIEPGADLKGELLATFGPDTTRDNFEGIEARRGPDGKTLVYLISDDNFNHRNQRTLLMMFELRQP